MPYIISSCDTHHSVVDFSLSALKLLKIDLESSSVEQILNMCLNKAASDNIRIKCMEYLNKSKKAANSFPHTVKVCLLIPSRFLLFRFYLNSYSPIQN